MTGFAHITSIKASPQQVMRAASAAEALRDTEVQNALIALLDRLMWPLAIGGLAVAATTPAVAAFVACTSFAGKPDERIGSPASITATRKEIAR